METMKFEPPKARFEVFLMNSGKDFEVQNYISPLTNNCNYG